MFAVPGWSVSATGLVPELTARSKVEVSKAERDSGSGELQDGRSTKKRKYSDTAGSIKASDLESVWEKRFGGQKTGKATSSGRLAKHDKSKDPTRDTKVFDKSADSETKATGLHDEVSTKDGRREKKKHKKSQSHAQNEQASPTVARPSAATITISPPAVAPPPLPKGVKLTPLQVKMREKLTSARFRHLNQTLYTTSSKDAMQLFTDNPDMFADYHAGFSQQVKDSWPKNPVDEYIRQIKSRGVIKAELAEATTRATLPLPRRKTGSCTIADLGCGDAPLARGCQSQTKALQLKFHNYDLHTPNSHVTKADISNLPLRDGEADIAVFCLSLMGTNWISFVEEAWRILRGDGRGEVWVAEVKSRFGRVGYGSSGRGRVVDHSVGKNRKPLASRTKNKSNDDADGGQVPDDELFAENDPSGTAGKDETDISAFVEVFGRRGFVLRETSVDKSNKMFVSMIFTKSGVPTAGKHKGLKWTGREYQRLTANPKGRASDNDDETSLLEEAKVLKPCVYKTR